MSPEVAKALQDVVPTLRASAWERQLLPPLVEVLEALGCCGLAAKLYEFKGKGYGPLHAELSVAKLIAGRIGCPVQLNIGNAADLHFSHGGKACLVEVVHKSSRSPLSHVFHPDPRDLADPSNNTPLDAAARRLHAALASLPVQVQPWFAGELAQPHADYFGRSKQEALCCEIADWLTANLPAAVRDGQAELKHPSELARFSLTQSSTLGGEILGSGPLSAFLVNDAALRHSLKQKCEKAHERMLSADAACYLVAAVVDDVFASDGRELLSTLLGPLEHDTTYAGGPKSLRRVPVAGRSLLDEAKINGRQKLLDAAKFDRSRPLLAVKDQGLFFEPVSRCVGGVIAIYYSGEVQFVPNPFSTTNINLLQSVFWEELTPVQP